jgi:hypothetical protein
VDSDAREDPEETPEGLRVRGRSGLISPIKPPDPPLWGGPRRQRPLPCASRVTTGLWPQKPGALPPGGHASGRLGLYHRAALFSRKGRWRSRPVGGPLGTSTRLHPLGRLQPLGSAVRDSFVSPTPPVSQTCHARLRMRALPRCSGAGPTTGGCGPPRCARPAPQRFRRPPSCETARRGYGVCGSLATGRTTSLGSRVRPSCTTGGSAPLSSTPSGSCSPASIGADRSKASRTPWRRGGRPFYRRHVPAGKLALDFRRRLEGSAAERSAASFPPAVVRLAELGLRLAQPRGRRRDSGAVRRLRSRCRSAANLARRSDGWQSGPYPRASGRRRSQVRAARDASSRDFGRASRADLRELRFGIARFRRRRAQASSPESE